MDAKNDVIQRQAVYINFLEQEICILRKELERFQTIQMNEIKERRLAAMAYYLLPPPSLN